MSVIRAPKACGLYSPGHSPHWIQARKGWEDQVHLPVPCRLIDCRSDGTVIIELEGDESRLWNHQPDRLSEVVAATHGVIKYQERWHLLLVKSSPGGHFLFSVAKAIGGHAPCPQTPLNESPIELLRGAGGFSIPMSELATNSED